MPIYSLLCCKMLNVWDFSYLCTECKLYYETYVIYIIYTIFIFYFSDSI